MNFNIPPAASANTIPYPIGWHGQRPVSVSSSKQSSRDPMIGKTLSHYKILDKLGAGGMGEVYLAEDTTLDREVALKVLPPQLAESQERLDRFQRVAKTLAALDHPNIVTMRSVEEHDIGNPCRT